MFIPRTIYRNIDLREISRLIKVRRFFRLHNVTIVGYFYYLFICRHVSAIRPSSSRHTFARTYSPRVRHIFARTYSTRVSYIYFYLKMVV
jgi:hypothetical protein